MKPEKRAAAHRLRREQGLSINEICRRLGAAISSVSIWVRDIELTPEQKAELERQHYAYRAQSNGGATNARKCRERRQQYQQEGAQKPANVIRFILRAVCCIGAKGVNTKIPSHLLIQTRICSFSSSDFCVKVY